MLRADREVVLAAVRQDWKALGYASDAVQVLDPAVLQNAGWTERRALAISCVGWRARGWLLLAALTLALPSCCILTTDDSMQADREVVLEAVAQSGTALLHAAPQVQADREVVLLAVSSDGTRTVKGCLPRACKMRVVPHVADQARGRHGTELCESRPTCRQTGSWQHLTGCSCRRWGFGVAANS